MTTEEGRHEPGLIAVSRICEQLSGYSQQENRDLGLITTGTKFCHEPDKQGNEFSPWMAWF